MKLSQSQKRFISGISTLSRICLQFGYIPFLIYLGFKQGAEPGMPSLTCFGNKIKLSIGQ
uniref:Mitochondrial import receptor subunit TOM7 homolog n=1 Tax=Romanomermis culicivorax TaxID=13658 RepID=A0A915KE73_ROMCU